MGDNGAPNYFVHELRSFIRSPDVATEIVLPTRAAIYCRVAAPAADLPISRQEQACRERAAELGWTVQEVLVHRSGSTFRPSRPGVAALLEAIENGAVDGLLAYDIYWTRNAGD